MTRLGLLSHCVLPTRNRGGDGLGRYAFDLARAFSERGYDVTLYGGIGSEWDGGNVIVHEDENARADVLDMDAQDWWIDLSHYHRLGQVHPHAPVLHYIVDALTPYQPPYQLVLNPRQWDKHPDAVLVHMGVFPEDVPFLPDTERTQYSYIAKIIWHKGYQAAWRSRIHLDAPLSFYGENLEGVTFPSHYEGEIIGDERLYDVLGQSIALIAPSQADMGSRAAIQAALVGTPTICLDGANSGMKWHVQHGVSGFVCKDESEIGQAARQARDLDPYAMRQWAACAWDIRRTACELIEHAREWFGQ